MPVLVVGPIFVVRNDECDGMRLMNECCRHQCFFFVSVVFLSVCVIFYDLFVGSVSRANNDGDPTEVTTQQGTTGW